MSFLCKRRLGWVRQSRVDVQIETKLLVRWDRVGSILKICISIREFVLICEWEGNNSMLTKITPPSHVKNHGCRGG